MPFQPPSRAEGPLAVGHHVLAGSAHPHTGGAPLFNALLAEALRRAGSCDYLSWRRMYPPLLYRGAPFADPDPPALVSDNEPVLDWHLPWTWRAAARRAGAARSLILPWMHPVMAPPYLGMMRRAGAAARVVICHNIVLHEPMRGAAAITRRVLSRADLLVLHSREQVAELEELGLGGVPRLEAFHPRLSATALAPLPRDEDVAAEVARQGEGLRLLFFGAIRPYKGLDLALRALTLVPDLPVHLVIAGRAWRGAGEVAATVARLGLEDRVTLHEGYVPARRTAVLMRAADAVILPYRTASQSGVAQVAFAYGRPVIATRVGGLPDAVRHDVDGLLCEVDADDIAAAIRRMAADLSRLTDGVEPLPYRESFERYGHLIEQALEGARR